MRALSEAQRTAGPDPDFLPNCVFSPGPNSFLTRPQVEYVKKAISEISDQHGMCEKNGERTLAFAYPPPESQPMNTNTTRTDLMGKMQTKYEASCGFKR